ncbi:hypothetical protein IQ279_16335 [Streptomyces verrucosisporus]|uniref:DUF6415 family natural product biosynthesis protein n=1 Tax=Streptomyces verrucosisporus TaxID=1695161 RepID=UPI0019D1C783|nr:DUF6415 family natural product biosynthesis protein [Streptomyces verrucosisporus]MBN3931180.1 hypothetical protein [Streptomyces verrucosisporus]
MPTAPPVAAPAAADTPVDVIAITATIDRALSIGTVLPRHEAAEDLVTELSGHLRRLLAAVPHAGQARAATAAGQAAAGPGPGLQSATDRARLLALDCRWLLRHLGHEGRPAR